MGDVETKAKNARQAFLQLCVVPAKRRNAVLGRMAKNLTAKKQEIMAANAKDIAESKKSGLSEQLVKRLVLSDEKFGEIISGVNAVKGQDDLVGKTISTTLLDKGLLLEQISTPIGVICAIFEARPDALVQIASLSIKSGNAAILKGGSEARKTNAVLAQIIRKSLAEEGLFEDAVQLIESREDVAKIISLSEYIDLIIPRGSSAFVKFIQQNSTIPVLGHSDGICHEYVDEHADTKKAVRICVDAKTQYPAVCNAMETLLVHEKIAPKFLPEFAKALNGKVELRCDPNSAKILSEKGFATKNASEKDWGTEYNDLILSIKTVSGLEEAITHINTYGSKHTDGIITENEKNAREFLLQVDSAGVYHNASTRFADGYRYGKGAEVGISTGKIHARGPSGMEALLTYKYILRGNGHIVADYTGKGAKKFLHKKL
ncbi:MAG: glutamate-5-semialdehyde dehydrogenase [archaeon]|nr:glutamate-5-semialdehyde dehydrogenase [archaeon]